MSSPQAAQSKDNLQDSWVELYYKNGSNGNSQNGATGLQEPQTSQILYPESIEKLLIEAQKESRTPSRNNSREASARGSPKSPHSPSNELSSSSSQDDRDPGTEWMWDWSSRPEVIPPSDLNGKFKHPAPRKSKLSVRNTPVMRSGIFRVFQLENLPILLLSHACAVFLGAAGLFMYLKKFHWPRAEILSFSVE